MSVRISEDLSTLKETDLPKKKGKACDVGTTEEPLLLEIAHKHRSKEFISRKWEKYVFQSNNLVTMSVPNSANVNASLYFIIVPECVRRYYKLVPNLECLGQKSRQSNTEIEDSLINSKLKIIAHTRLADHITSHISLNFSDYDWKFMMHNVRQISDMLKM